MFKKISMAIVIGSALFSTHGFAELKKKNEELQKRIAEIEELKASKAKEITGRHAFPIYKTQDTKNVRYFVAIRTQSAGLQNHVIDHPNSEGSSEQIWVSYTNDLLDVSEGQNSLEFQEALNALDESILVGFYVFSSKDWKDSEIAPFLLSDEDLIASLAVSSPYFDNTNTNPTSDVDSYGVVFQTNPARSLALGKRLMKLVNAKETARTSNKDL